MADNPKAFHPALVVVGVAVVDFARSPIAWRKRPVTPPCGPIVLAAMMLAAMVVADPAIAQVREDLPTRGTYQPPILQPVRLHRLDTRNASSKHGPGPSSADDANQVSSIDQLRPASHQEIRLFDPPSGQPAAATTRAAHSQTETIQPVGHVHSDHQSFPHQPSANQHWIPESEVQHGWEENVDPHDWDDHCDGYACDGAGCDNGDCDGIGRGWWRNASLSHNADDWFGSLELLLLFRSGDRLPVLVTTGDSDATADTQPLFGDEIFLDNVTAGGRVTIGTWIDPQHDRSFVFRGWAATEENFSFFSDQEQNPILGIPFSNTGDGTDDVQIVASPGRADGSVTAIGTSNVFGADLSVRQPWWQGLGLKVDLLYGYQYMRLTEDLTLGRSSVSLADDFAPVGSTLSLTDSFDVDNEFHGGQFGIASRYEEGCWSFTSLLKVGFGSLLRRADLSGETLTSIDGLNAVDPQGLFVRNTNSGVTEDSTFGWVPELDLSLGYRKFPNYEITIGYHIIALTDTLQVSGALDPNLASNLTAPLVGPANPELDLRFSTFYVQGIHFGIQYVH